MKPRTRRCDSKSPESGFIKLFSLHLRHGHLISVMLFRFMSDVADFNHLSTMASLIVRTMVAYAVQRARELEPQQYAWSPPEKIGMTFAKNRTFAECHCRRNGNESTFRQNIGNSFSRHRIWIESTIQFHM